MMTTGTTFENGTMKGTCLVIPPSRNADATSSRSSRDAPAAFPSAFNQSSKAAMNYLEPLRAGYKEFSYLFSLQTKYRSLQTACFTLKNLMHFMVETRRK